MFSCKSSCPLWLDSTIFSFCASHFHLFLFGWAPLQKFHNLVTVNSSMVNAEMQSSLACSAFGSFMVYQEVGELDRGEVLSAVFRGPSILVSLMVALIPHHVPRPRVLSSMYDISAFLLTVILTEVRCSLSVALICVWWLKMLHTFVKHLPPTCALHRSACGLTCPFLLGYLLRWTYFFAWLMLCSLSSADQYWKGFPTLWTASSLCWVPLAAEAF